VAKTCSSCMFYVKDPSYCTDTCDWPAQTELCTAHPKMVWISIRETPCSLYIEKGYNYDMGGK